MGRVREEGRVEEREREREREREKQAEERRYRCAKCYETRETLSFAFPLICGSGGSKSRLAKAAGAKPSGQMINKKLHAIVARSTSPSQNAKNMEFRTTFQDRC